MSAVATPFIAADGVSKTYNPGRADEVRAVEAVTMHVDRGEVLVLEGPSGSGKTSLLSLIGCMSRPTSGRIVVDGRDVAKLAEGVLTEERRRRFGFIFQQFHLIPDLPAIDKYNIGQKQLFWTMIVTMILLLVSGIILWRPYFADMFAIPVIRIAAVVHMLAFFVLLMGIIVHIYSAIFWVRGSMRAMTRGTVSHAWAKHHHALWYKRVTGQSK